MRKTVRIDIILHMLKDSHMGVCPPLKLSIVSKDSADSEGPDQTARMRRLI